MADAHSRILRDLNKIIKEQPSEFTASPIDPNNLFKWNATIFGPPNTPWEGGIFQLTIDFTEKYPHEPPRVRFITPIFHPNVYSSGDICLDILQDKWSPVYDISSILLSIQSMLTDPNPNSPANAKAASLFLNDRQAYEEEVLTLRKLSFELLSATSG